MERELKRGTLEMVLLRLLNDRDMYGYEIVTTLQRRSDGNFEIKDGTLYPVLYRLEKAGFVEPEWQTQERGVPRKYYRVTTAGRKEVNRLVEEWRAFAGAIDQLLEGEAR